MEANALVVPKVLGELLVARGIISKKQLRSALAELVCTMEKPGQKKHLGQILIAQQLITYDQLDTLLTEQEWIEAELQRLGGLKLPVYLESLQRKR